MGEGLRLRATPAIAWDANGQDFFWNAPGFAIGDYANRIPYGSGNRANPSADWLLSNGMPVMSAPIPSPYQVTDQPVVDFSATHFSQRYYKPPVNWGYFRVSYYHGSYADPVQESDRFYEYMLYDENGLSRLLNPWADQYAEDVDGQLIPASDGQADNAVEAVSLCERLMGL